MGAFGGAMDMMDNVDNLLAMEEEIGQANDGQATDTFEVTFSISFDEDDSNTLNLDLA